MRLRIRLCEGQEKVVSIKTIPPPHSAVAPGIYWHRIKSSADERKKRCANPLSSCEWIDGEIAWQQAGSAQFYWSELEKENKTVVVASGFLVCFLSISPLIVGGNGKITGACWRFLTITNKNSATNCRDVASRWGERALEYYSPRTWWEKLQVSYMEFFLFFCCAFYWTTV